MFKFFRRKMPKMAQPARTVVAELRVSDTAAIDNLIREIAVAKWERTKNRCSVCGLWTANIAMPDYWTIATAVYACDLHYHLVSPWVFKFLDKELVR